MDFTKFGEYGLLGLMIGAIIILLFLIVKWTLATTRDILAQANKERESWHNILITIVASVDRISKAIDQHDVKADERGRYVREEHKEMIETLGRINGHVK